MGVFERLIGIIRGYFTAASARIERAAEEAEHRARLEAVRELEAGQTTRPPPVERPAPAQHQLTADYRLLGLPPGADLAQAEAAWRRLADRADPKRFPAGSDEEQRAAQILTSVNQAYARIRELLNPTEGRFGRLEL